MHWECIWVHSESVYALQMYPMRYGSAYGPYLWSVCATIAHWVHLESIDALRMHPNAFQCIWVHLESVYALQMYPMRYGSAYGPYLWSVCAMVATIVHWVHLESIDALQMHPNALECIWVHLESVYALQMYPMHYGSAYGP